MPGQLITNVPRLVECVGLIKLRCCTVMQAGAAEKDVPLYKHLADLAGNTKLVGFLMPPPSTSTPPTPPSPFPLSLLESVSQGAFPRMLRPLPHCESL